MRPNARTDSPVAWEHTSGAGYGARRQPSQLAAAMDNTATTQPVHRPVATTIWPVPQTNVLRKLTGRTFMSECIRSTPSQASLVK